MVQYMIYFNGIGGTVHGLDATDIKGVEFESHASDNGIECLTVTFNNGDKSTFISKAAVAGIAAIRRATEIRP